MTLSRKLAHIGWVLVVAVASGSCGGDDSGDGGTGGTGGTPNPNAEACAFACTGPAPCDTFPDQGTCEEQCLAETEGQSEACAECIVESVTWRWTTCNGSGSPCVVCEYYTSEITGEGGTCGPTTCTEPSAMCNNYEIFKHTDTVCRDTCTP